MGGRGQVMKTGGFQQYDYYTTTTISGIKVIAKNGDSHSGLPEYSNTPSTMYFRQNNKGEIDQLRIYSAQRRAKIDIDWGHSHDGIPKGTAHIQKYTIGPDGHPQRAKNAQLLSNYYVKKYKSIILAANPNVKFK